MLMRATSRRAGRTGAGHIAAPPDTAKAAILQTVVADLAAETDSLVTILARLATADWDTPTPAEGWTIRDQVTHLAFFDDATLLAGNDPAPFAAPAAARRACSRRSPREAGRDRAADRERVGLLRRPARGDARHRGGRSRGCRHRRLSRRTDDADLVEGQTERPVGRLRPHLPPPAGAGAGHRAGPGDPDRHERGRTQPGRARRPDRRARRSSRPGAQGDLARRRRPGRPAGPPARGRP